MSSHQWEFDLTLLGPESSSMSTNMNNSSPSSVTNQMMPMLENLQLETPSTSTNTRFGSRTRAPVSNIWLANRKSNDERSLARRFQQVSTKKQDEDDENIQFVANLLPYVRRIPRHRKPIIQNMIRVFLKYEQNDIPPYPPPPYPNKRRDFEFTVPEIPPWRRTARNSRPSSNVNSTPRIPPSYNDSMMLATQTMNKNATWNNSA